MSVTTSKKTAKKTEKIINDAVEKHHDVSPEVKQRSEKLAKIMAEELKTVKGRFQFFECPGGSTRVIVKKYPGHIFDKTMLDGEEYEVPLYVARHLNGTDATASAVNGKINSCAYPVHGYKMDNRTDLKPSFEGQGGIPVPIIGIAKWIRRYGFQSLEFGG